MRQVFISYRHESEAHAQAVRALAERLRDAGLPVELDQFYWEASPAAPKQGWPIWYANRVAEAEAILVVTSPGWFAAYQADGVIAAGPGTAAEAQVVRKILSDPKAFNARVRFVELETSGGFSYPLTLAGLQLFRPARRAEDFTHMVTWIRQRLGIVPVANESDRAAIQTPPPTARPPGAEFPAEPPWRAGQTHAPATQSSRVFICYRRDDSEDATGRIYDRLETEFGYGTIFRDIDAIPPGVDFRKHIHDVLSTCSAVLVVIGRDWLTVTDEDGRPRLEDPRDHVRLEIEAALAREGLCVIPVLVRQARVPAPDNLPPSLEPLSYRNAVTVRGDPDFRHDVQRLIRHMHTILGTSAPPTRE